ncbi:dual specificity protein phosphatase 1-like [Aplysia californica]|uniref:Dual specificity protein phosphatase 1-like n=1 Tax=Aplysia californica TaxID=6500 RepID=A0ABM1VZN4_APLCA|nr:dual specificity protein phosphatase 1-like [Aplysia californica]
MYFRRITLDEAFDYIRSRRHVIWPNTSFMMQLNQFETELSSFAPRSTTGISLCPAELGTPTIYSDHFSQTSFDITQAVSTTTNGQNGAQGIMDTADLDLVVVTDEEDMEEEEESDSLSVSSDSGSVLRATAPLAMFVSALSTPS